MFLACSQRVILRCMANPHANVYVLVTLFNVQAWGIRVVGRLRQERWTDKDGGNRERILVVAEHVEFKKEPNTTTKADEREELDELDQEIAF